MESPEQQAEAPVLQPEIEHPNFLQRTAENLRNLGASALESMPSAARRPLAIGASALALAGCTGVGASMLAEKADAGTIVDTDFDLNTGHHGHYPPTESYNQICSDSATARPSSYNFIKNSSRYINRQSDIWKIHIGAAAFQACGNMGVRKISYFQQIKNPQTGKWRRFTRVRGIKTNKLFELYGSYQEPLNCHGAEEKRFPNVRTVIRASWIPKKNNKKGVPASNNWYQKTRKAHC